MSAYIADGENIFDQRGCGLVGQPELGRGPVREQFVPARNGAKAERFIVSELCLECLLSIVKSRWHRNPLHLIESLIGDYTRAETRLVNANAGFFAVIAQKA
jgi:hypothetical protein